jgi:hypothetical protein
MIRHRLLKVPLLFEKRFRPDRKEREINAVMPNWCREKNKMGRTTKNFKLDRYFPGHQNKKNCDLSVLFV